MNWIMIRQVSSGGIVMTRRPAWGLCCAREEQRARRASWGGSSRLVKSQAARSDPREFTSSPVSRNGERARFPLEAEQEFDSGKDFLDGSAFRKQNVDVMAYVVQKRKAP